MPFPSSPPEAGGWPIPIWRPRGPPHLPPHKKILNLLSPHPKLDVPLSLPLGRPPRLSKPPRKVSFRAEDAPGVLPDLTFSESEPSPIPPEVLDLASPKSQVSRFSGQTFGVTDSRKWTRRRASAQSKDWRISTLMEDSEPVTPDTPPEMAPNLSPLIPASRPQPAPGPVGPRVTSPRTGYPADLLDRPRGSDGTDSTKVDPIQMVMPEPWANTSKPAALFRRRSSRRSASSRSSENSAEVYTSSVQTGTAQRVVLPPGESIKAPTPVRFSKLLAGEGPPVLPRIQVRPLSFRLPPAHPPPDHPPPLPPKPWDGGIAGIYPSLIRGKTPFPFAKSPRAVSPKSTPRPDNKRKPSDQSTSGTSFNTAPEPGEVSTSPNGFDDTLPRDLANSLDATRAPSPDESTTPSELILSHHRRALLHFLRLLHCLSLARELLYARNLVSMTLLHSSPFPPDLKREWERRLDDWWLTSSGILNMARQRVRESLKKAEKDWEWAVEVMGGDVVREKKGLKKYWEDEEKPGWSDPGSDQSMFLGGGFGLGRPLARSKSGASVRPDGRPGGLKKQPSFLGRPDHTSPAKGVPSWVGEVVNECFGYDEIEAEVWRLELDGKIPTGTWRRMYGERAFRAPPNGSSLEHSQTGDFGQAFRDRVGRVVSRGSTSGRQAHDHRRSSGRLASGAPRSPKSPGRDTDSPSGWWIMDEAELQDARAARVDQIGVDDQLGKMRDQWRRREGKVNRWSMIT